MMDPRMDMVAYDVIDGVAVARINNPPANVLEFRLRRDLLCAIEAAEQDPAVRALIITGGDKAFVGGADIREFGKPYEEPTLWRINDALLAFPKPVVAAIAGFALGGGLELALHCHWRIAALGAKLGLPEVLLGLMPGAGGTQYWTRLAGPESALKALTSGASILAQEALTLGLVDAIASSDLLAAAREFVNARLTEGAPLPGYAKRIARIKDVPADLFARFRASNAERWAGQIAQGKIVDCVEAACTRPIADALEMERREFAACAASPQAKALMHLFFAERKAGRVESQVALRAVQSVGVAGAGTMGGGIAMAFANAGFPVTLLDVAPAALERGMAAIAANYVASVRRGSTTQAAADAAQRKIAPTLQMAALSSCDLIVEAAFEDAGIKRELFARLDSVVRSDAVIATNTSMLDIDLLAAAVSHPERFVGMHFFSPANVMKLLEVVAGAKTSQDVLATATALGRKLGKIPVLAGNGEGFIGNFILDAYGREADLLIEDGATPWQVDSALRGFGFAMGLFAMRDMAGLDVIQCVRVQRRESERPGRYPLVADRICAMGRFGQKSGAGYYVYEGRQGAPDPVIDALIEEVSRARGIPRRAISDEEALERVLCAMANAGARLLENRVARSAADIDLVMVHGYGFPRYLGGPMHWAAQRGLASILDSVRRFQRSDDAPPSLLLETLAASGRSWDD